MYLDPAQPSGTIALPSGPAQAEAADAQLFEAVAASGPQQEAASLSAAQGHHHARHRPIPARRGASRTRRSMAAGEDDAEIDTSSADAEAERATKHNAAVSSAAAGRDDGGRGAGFRNRQETGRDDDERPGHLASRVPGTKGRTPSPISSPAAGAAAVRLVPPPPRAFVSQVVPARLPPQTPAMLERNATAKLPLATRMARAHPHRGLVSLFAFKGQSLYSPKKRLAGMLWWANWRAMRGYARLPSREAPRAGLLKPSDRVPFSPAFIPTPRAAPVFRQPGRGTATLQAWSDRPATAAISAFPIHCGEPYGLRAALAWQAREDARRQARAAAPAAA